MVLENVPLARRNYIISLYFIFLELQSNSIIFHIDRNISSGQCYTTYRGHTGSVNCIRFHPTKQLVLTASGDCSVHLWPFESPVSLMMSSGDEDLPSDRDEG